MAVQKIDIGTGANTGTGTPIRDAFGRVNDVIDLANSIQTSQASGLIAYKTKADMDADHSKPDGSLAQVTNDPTTANNQSYRYDAATTTWVASVDRLANALGNASGFQQAGTGSVTRTFQDKAREWVSVKDKGAAGDGVTDDTAVIQAAIDTVSAAGGGAVMFPLTAGGYAITSLSVPAGVELCAMTFGGKPIRAVDTAVRFIPLATTGALVVLSSNTAIRGFCFHNPGQKYALTATTDSWNADALPIQLGSATDTVIHGVCVEDCAVVGFTRFIEQHDAVTNVEQLAVRRIGGMPLSVGINVKRSGDIPRYSDIHWNLNSYKNKAGSLLSGDTTIFYRKVATECTPFKFGDVDGNMLVNCFAYGVKRLIHFYPSAYTGDTNAGGGATLVNCAADVCHEGILVERTDVNFGISWSGGFITPVVKVSGSEQAAVKFGAGVTNTKVVMLGVRSGGSTVSTLGDATYSGSPNYHFVWDSAGSNNAVQAVGGWYVQHVVNLTSGEDPTVSNYAALASIANGQALLNRLRTNLELVGTGTDSPSVVWSNETGDKWECDNNGAAGSSTLRYLLNGTLIFDLTTDGTFEAKKNGGGFRAVSTGGSGVVKYGANDDGIPTASGLPLGQKVAVPATATSTGKIGQWAADGSYLYVCSNTNTWRRVAIAAW